MNSESKVRRCAQGAERGAQAWSARLPSRCRRDTDLWGLRSLGVADSGAAPVVTRAERLRRRGLAVGVCGEKRLRFTLSPFRPSLISRPALSPQAGEPGSLGAALSNLFGTSRRNDLRWESREKEREKEGAAACGNEGSSKEAERDCRVPLDLHRHSGLERRGEALCACHREDFESPSSAFPPRLFLCCQVLLINGGAGSSGSREPVCARERGGGRAWKPVFNRRAPGAELGTRGGRVWNLPSACSLSPLGPSHSPPPPHSPTPLLSQSLTPHRYQELSGNRQDFSGCRLRCIYPNTSSSQAPCRKRLRLVCTPTPRPYAGLEVAPSARAAASPASKGGWTSGAPRLSGLSLLGSAWQPPPLLVLRKPAPPGSPAVKTESKFPYRGSPNFPRGRLSPAPVSRRTPGLCKLATEILWRLWKGRAGWGGGRRGHWVTEPGPGRNARERATFLISMQFLRPRW
nr:uncharacterized protein LOC105726729 [Aotus nancymaae]